MDIVLSVRTDESLASPENYQKGPRARTLGVFIHSTRGGTRRDTEYSSTVNWFQNPDAQVSAHLVIGLPPFEQVARCVHDDDIAWHAREANQTHLSIELCQPTITDPITDFQYRAAAEACRLWAAKYHFPTTRSMSIVTPGIIGHEDSEPGKRDHKSDPGPAFDWAKFLALTGGQPVPPVPTPTPTPSPVAANKLRDQSYALAEQIQALGPKWRSVGYPQMAEYVETQGEAIKKTLVISKGER